MHEQLQDFLNECINRGWKLFFNGHIYSFDLYDGDIIYGNGIKLSLHDLFSVESGLMEFVEWYARRGKNYVVAYHTMSTMTAEQKIQYFLDNALLPDHLGKNKTK